MTDDTERSFAAECAAKLEGRSMADRRVLLVGLLNKHLPSNRQAVLVGGAAVEFYTTGGYTTGDVDLVGDRALVARLLRAAGFREQGRLFLHHVYGLVAEVPSFSLRPSETPTQVEFEGYVIPILPVEDVIVDRLLAAKYWRSPTDWEQALLLAATHASRLNEQALQHKALANEVEDVLRDLLEAIRSKAKRKL